MSVFRVYVEKKEEYSVEAQSVLRELTALLKPKGLKGIRIVNRYDAQWTDTAENSADTTDFERAVRLVLSEPQLDSVSDITEVTVGDGDNKEHAEWLTSLGKHVFAVSLLPGQYDQRADFAAQSMSMLTGRAQPIVNCARLYVLTGTLSADTVAKIKEHLINPIESCEVPLTLSQSLDITYPTPEAVEVIDGFTKMNNEALSQLLSDYSLAMDIADITLCRDYFRGQDRDPTITEMRMLDTYWSDHCRHTTFLTEIKGLRIDDSRVMAAFSRYQDLRSKLGRKLMPITLMDMATIGTRALKADGLLDSLDQSEEINACSVKIDVDVDGKNVPYLLMFKNETHNHPTEIEPFGGAATCLGGAIRDPLSGRAYVYQAMRISGAANPLTSLANTKEGKLPQRTITTRAAAGYSSYGNQIGLATGLVREIYHPGYEAKRMEVGAVVAAVPEKQVVREVPESGDVVLLIGGKTGRDGCGGATGSSRSHTEESLTECGSEVQKGNAPEERKLLRLFRNPKFSVKIKRCNDFGAGGVSVAVGELADSLEINLDAVPKKYAGLDGTELAISESQERMAVVVAAKDVKSMIAMAAEENLTAVEIAKVTDSGYLNMYWRGEKIVSLRRSFLNSNGAPKQASAAVPVVTPKQHSTEKAPLKLRMERVVSALNMASQKGLVERFDSSVGGGTVLSPYGGLYRETPTQSMAAKIPLIKGTTDTASIMSWGFDPYISQHDPYEGAVYAVFSSVAKVVAAGGSRKKCWLTFQDYFRKLGSNPTNWGQPLAALLGGLDAQMALSCAAIGGKDSMSGTFENIHVPPTLISFAVSVGKASKIISPEFKGVGNVVSLLAPVSDTLVEYTAVIDKLESLIAEGKVLSAWVTTSGGVAEGLFKMSLGNKIGVDINYSDVSGDKTAIDGLFEKKVCRIIVESAEPIEGLLTLGSTTKKFNFTVNGESCTINSLIKQYEDKLESVFPTKLPTPKIAVPTYSHDHVGERKAPAVRVAKPKVILPVFPGTNCEYDTARAFERAGATTEIFVVKNRTQDDIAKSVSEFAKRVGGSQIIAIPGGFSAGDEPEGSAKFITAFFRNAQVSDAVTELLEQKDGLMLGICNGFQALIKLGLLPYGKITDPTELSPTLTFNRIGRHQSGLVITRVASNMSPWLMHSSVGDMRTIPISHGEGRFVATVEELERLAKNGQVATQYVDTDGAPTLDIAHNPNFSLNAVEGITSPDGRVFGRMAHPERAGDNIHKNIPGVGEDPMFRSAVEYFKG